MMGNRQRSHREPNQHPDTPPDATPAADGHGDTTEALPEGVRAVVFRTMHGDDAGRVQLVDGRVLMSPDAARFLDGLTVILPERGRVTPADGEDYLLGLLVSFRGSALWAEVER